MKRNYGSRKKYCLRGHRNIAKNRYKNHECRLCMRAKAKLPKEKLRHKIWVERNKRWRKLYMKMYLYRMDEQSYQHRFKKQKGKCAICNKPLKVVYVDHDHKCCPPYHKRTCGKCTRGFLCVNCNRGLGSFFDNVKSLRNAARYILKWRLINQ